MVHWQTLSFKTPHLRLYFNGLRTVKSVTLIFDEFTFGGSLDVLQMSLLCAHLETHRNIFTFKLRAWLTNQQANYISLQIYQYQRSCRSLSNKIYQYRGAATIIFIIDYSDRHSVYCHIIKRKDRLSKQDWPHGSLLHIKFPLPHTLKVGRDLLMSSMNKRNHHSKNRLFSVHMNTWMSF